MPKKLKFNKDKQYYIDMSTESILDSIKEDVSGLDILGHKRDLPIVTSLEGGIYIREFGENNQGGIEIVTLDKLDQYAEYLTQVTLPLDDISFKVVEDCILCDICVNKVILGQGFDLCDISSIDTLGIKVTKDIVRQIGKKDRVDTLQALLDSNRIKKSWGNIVLEWANKVETLEWANSNLTCNIDKDDLSLGEAYYTAFLDCNIDKIRWLLEHEFEIDEVSVDQLGLSLQTGRLDIFELLKKYNILEGINLVRTLAISLKHNQFELSSWLISNLESEDMSKDISLAIIRTFGNYDSDKIYNYDNKHYYNKFTSNVLYFLLDHNVFLDNDALTTVFLNACEHNTVDVVEYLFEHYDISNNADIKKEAIGIASKYSSINVFTILTTKFGNNQVNIYDAVYNASVSGNVLILNQLYDSQKEAFMKVMNRNDFDSTTAILKKYKNHSELILSQSTGNIEVLKWYRANGLFSVPIINLFDLAFSKGQVETLSWLESEYKPDYTKHFNNKYYHINSDYKHTQITRRRKLLRQTNDQDECEVNPMIKSLQWLKDRNFVFNSNFKKELFELEHMSIFNKSNDLLDWLKQNILTSADAIVLAKCYTGEHSYMKDKLNWLLKNYPEHSEFINTQLKKTRSTVDGSAVAIDDYGDELSDKKSGRKSRVPQCAQS